MQWINWVGWGLSGIVMLLLLDQLAIWMESKECIYWRKSKGGSSCLGNSFLEVQSMFEPGKKYVIESKQEVRRKKTNSGDPPSPGKASPKENDRSE